MRSRGSSEKRVLLAALVLAADVLAAAALVLAGGSPTASAGLLGSDAAAKHYVFAFLQFPFEAGEFRNAVWEVSADGAAVRKVVSLPSDDISSPRWSPDGKLLAAVGNFSLRTGFDLIVMDPDGSHRRALNGGDDCWDEISWLPDGRSIACAPAHARRIRIVATQSQTSRIVRISAKPGQPVDSLNSIDWSPRGDRFVTDDAEGVHVVGANGTVLAAISKDGEFPRWSPDGKHILFIESDLEGDTIVVVNPTGTNWRVVVHVPIFDAVASAAWSPDAKSIAYIGQNGLHIVDVQTGNDRLLNRLATLCGPNPQPGCADLDWRVAE